MKRRPVVTACDLGATRDHSPARSSDTSGTRSSLERAQPAREHERAVSESVTWTRAAGGGSGIWVCHAIHAGRVDSPGQGGHAEEPIPRG